MHVQKQISCAQGLAGLSIQWGAWAEGGMAAANAGTAKAVERMGIGMIAPAAGILSIQRLLFQTAEAAPSLAAAVPFHWERFLRRLDGVPPMFTEFADAVASPGPSAQRAPARAQPATQALPSADPAVLRGSVLAQVQDAVASVLGSSVGLEDPLMAAGLDSLGTVELRNALEKQAGLELPSTLVFDYPTVDAITTFLAGKLALAQSQAGVVSDGLVAPAYYESTDLQPVGAERPAAPKLIGISELVVRSAGGALLQSSPSDQPRPIPVRRWDVEAQAELCGGIPVQFGVFLEDVGLFDAPAMGVSETEAALMDPQQRMLLESVAEAMLAHPAEAADAQLRANWGVFVVSGGRIKAGLTISELHGINMLANMCVQGMSSNDYARLAAKHIQGVTAYSATGTALSVVSGRVSYTMRLKGPAVTMDTACSSSLVSLHMAFNSLLAQQASLAINAGVNLMLMPDTPAMFQRAGMMTPDGRCKTLDAAADGYVRAESIITALLHPASSSGAAGWAVLLRGTAVNQGGRSSTLTAPNGPSQQDVIRNALRDASAAPSTISGLQMHGTGTALGDPIEVGAAAAVLVEGHNRSRKEQPLALMASKSWVGHAEPAAGMVGVAHATLALGGSLIPGISHLREINSYVINSMRVAGGAVESRCSPSLCVGLNTGILLLLQAHLSPAGCFRGRRFRLLCTPSQCSTSAA